MNPICTTCGTQYSDANDWPDHCLICEDERQYVGLDGQRWTTLDDLQNDHTIKIEAEEHFLTSFSVDPHFAIGQRAFVIQTSAGNILWDCISLLDAPTVDYIGRLGGLDCICISHPHYYTTMLEWSRAFGGIPVYLHRDDSRWVMREDGCLEFWEGETKSLPGGLTLIRCGGHFEGAAVLHWPSGADGKGALLSGDTVQVVPDRKFVSFMYSYPNYVPLDAAAIERIVDAVKPFAFDIVYGAFPKMTIAKDAQQTIRRSALRYLRAIGAQAKVSGTMAIDF